MESNVSMMVRLTLDSILSYILRNGSSAVLMDGYTCLYTLWISVLEIGIPKRNFTEALRIGLYWSMDSN